MWNIISGWFMSNLLTLAKWGAILGAIAAILLGARNAGRNAERVDNLQALIKARKRADEIENSVSKLPSGGALNQLRRDWGRGD